MKNFRGKGGDRFSSGNRQMHQAVCSNCGDKCEVPFKPTGDKPVLCSDCFSSSKGGDSRGSDRGSSRKFDRRGGDRFSSGNRQMHQAVCSNCGDKCEVPFKPTGDKPIFCSNCFEKQGRSGSGSNNKESKGQLEALNAKLDKIIDILTSSAVATLTPGKEIVKNKSVVKKVVKKVATAKKAEKKAKAKKK